MYVETSYQRRDYVFKISMGDPSGYGCIREIILNDEYGLSRFNGFSGTIVDIGANCGVATTILARQNPAASLFAFEPHPRTCENLRENLRLNGITNVTVINSAVGGSEQSHVTLCEHPEFSGGNTMCSEANLFGQYHAVPISSLEVACTSLDSFLGQHDIQSIDLLKIDCEGGEYEILGNSVAMRRGVIQNIVGELHDLSYNCQVQGSSEELLALCDECIKGVKSLSVLKLA